MSSFFLKIKQRLCRHQWRGGIPMTAFHVGQKVVCIRGATRSSMTRGNWAPKTGGVYTVRGIYNGPERVDLNFEEYVHHEFHDCGAEYGWDASRFRPVVERKTDISIFTDMLKTQRVRTDA